MTTDKLKEFYENRILEIRNKLNETMKQQLEKQEKNLHHFHQLEIESIEMRYQKKIELLQRGYQEYLTDNHLPICYSDNSEDFLEESSLYHSESSINEQSFHLIIQAVFDEFNDIANKLYAFESSSYLSQLNLIRLNEENEQLKKLLNEKTIECNLLELNQKLKSPILTTIQTSNQEIDVDDKENVNIHNNNNNNNNNRRKSNSISNIQNGQKSNSQTSRDSLNNKRLSNSIASSIFLGHKIGRLNKNSSSNMIIFKYNNQNNQINPYVINRRRSVKKYDTNGTYVKNTVKAIENRYKKNTSNIELLSSPLK